MSNRKSLSPTGWRVPLKALLTRLAAEGIISVLVEGGAEVHRSFIREGLVDRVCWFVAPMLIGGIARLADAPRLRDATVSAAGGGFLVTAQVAGRVSRSRHAVPRRTVR